MALLKSITLKNFLSFGPNSETVDLGPLNLIVGANGTGKSNLLEAVDLLRAAPNDIQTPIRRGGGISDWIWNKTPGAIASVEAVAQSLTSNFNLRYAIRFASVGQQLQIEDERVEKEKPDTGHTQPYFYYRFENGRPTLNVKGEKRTLQREAIDETQSILSQRKDPEQYPELTHLGTEFGGIRLFREWSFGRSSAPRVPQKADEPNAFLNADATNLGLVLSRQRLDPATKSRFLSALRELYDGIEDYELSIVNSTVQLYLVERGISFSAHRLSDGTLRYLCLLAILCDPNPPKLICIEEPELGLHPDIIPTLARLLREASERCQIIVTTHSAGLVDAMTDTPEAVLVAERDAEGTSIKRLSAEQLRPWLEQYRLGELWARGDVGGNRW